MNLAALPSLAQIDAEYARRGLPIPGQAWPNKGPQMDAFTTEAFETLYGGRPRGGKSFLGLMLAKYKHRRSLLVRRTFSDLERGLILDSYKVFGNPNLYNSTKHVWTLDGGARRVEFAYLQHDKDVHNYQGGAWDFFMADEVTQLTRNQYLYLFSRVVTTDPNQRCRILATANPGGEGNEWVFERWAAWLDEGHPNPAKPGELRWYARIDDRDVEVDGPAPIIRGNETHYPKSRTFIPAAVEDNPYINADEYNANLQALPEPYRSQLLKGDWRIGLNEDAYQIIPRAWVKAAMDRWTPKPPDDCKDIPPVLGVDIARGGEDKTVMATRRGRWIAPLKKVPGRLTPDGQTIAQMVMAGLENGGAANLDVSGVGSSGYDICKGQGLPVYAVVFGGKSVSRDKNNLFGFQNKRAEIYWKLREALDPQSDKPLMLPPDPELMADLTCVRSKPDSLTGMCLEKKDEIKARIGRSPDCGDALAMCLINRISAAEYAAAMKD